MQRPDVKPLLIIALLFERLLLAPTAAQDLRRVRVAVTSPGMTNLGLYLADRRGFFKEQQIFNEIIVMRSAARQIQALVAGSIEFSAQAPDPLIRAVEHGANLTMLSGLANAAAYDLVADKKYASIEALRGSTLGVSGINSSSTLLLQRMLAAHGLVYRRDFALVEVGGTADRLAAVRTGAISAGVLNPPISYVAAEEGFRILGELKIYIPAVQFTALSVRRAWAAQNPKLTEDYLIALLRANRYLYENRSGTVAIIRDFFKVRADHAERVYDYWVREKIIPRQGAMTVAGTEVVIDILEQLGDFKGKSKPKAEKFIDGEPLARARPRL
ncbi:MAG: ABC transporter substrate-binding protein [Deltaproteobacteria bacterium]|nr:ABC transporter substrate-binding protein [Deltaproteobacteria bacterium]